MKGNFIHLTLLAIVLVTVYSNIQNSTLKPSYQPLLSQVQDITTLQFGMTPILQQKSLWEKEMIDYL